MRFVISISFLLFSAMAYGASGDVPHETVFSQLANLSILIFLLWFTQRKAISQAFADKKANYLQSVQEASDFKNKAQKKLDEVKTRVTSMEKTFDQQVEDAKKHAEESYRSQLATAKNEAQRIMDTAAHNLEFEIQKEMENLRVETFKKSANLAEQNLEKTLSPEQLKAWNTHFVNAAEGAN